MLDGGLKFRLDLWDEPFDLLKEKMRLVVDALDRELFARAERREHRDPCPCKERHDEEEEEKRQTASSGELIFLSEASCSTSCWYELAISVTSFLLRSLHMRQE